MTKEWTGEGIDPRFTLANERTYLAWTRTSLALIAGGIAFAELLPRANSSGHFRWLGVPLIIVGVVVAITAEARREHVQRALERGESVPRSKLPLLLTGVVATLGIAASLVMLL